MLRPLGYLSNRIREPVYQDGDVDVLRERLCLLALLIGLLTGLGYLVVIVLTRGYSIQTVVNPTWGDVEAAETLVTCPCSASDVLQYDALVPRASCRANDTAVAGAGLQKQVALVASYSASKRHLWASAVEEMVAPPVPEWEQYFLGGRDPAAVYRELEVAQRYGAFLMNCFPATFSYTTHTNLVELRDCGCRGGLCDGFLGANSLLRDPRFNCTYQREALEAFGVSNWTMSRALFNYTWALEGNQSDPRPVSLGVDPAELDLALLALEHVERLASFPAKVAADLYGVDFMPQVFSTGANYTELFAATIMKLEMPYRLDFREFLTACMKAVANYPGIDRGELAAARGLVALVFHVDTLALLDRHAALVRNTTAMPATVFAACAPKTCTYVAKEAPWLVVIRSAGTLGLIATSVTLVAGGLNRLQARSYARRESLFELATLGDGTPRADTPVSSPRGLGLQKGSAVKCCPADAGTASQTSDDCVLSFRF